MIQPLKKTSKIGKRYGGIGMKYFVDCIDAANKTECDKIVDSITNKEIIYSKSNPEIAIIQSIMEYYGRDASRHVKNKTYKKTSKIVKSRTSKSKSYLQMMQKPIVIKTWHYVTGYEGIYREFKIGKQLQDIPGFIKFIAFMQCYDNSYDKKTRKEINEEISKKSKKDIITMKIKDEKICQGSDDIKQLLIMPYYPMSSMGSYQWNETQSLQIRSLIEQVIWSCYSAFVKYGFIHNDLHLQNILLDNTTNNEIIYDIVLEDEPKTQTIVTNGIQAIIMDFERSIIDSTPQSVGFQTPFAKITKQKKLWEDFRRFFNELDDLYGVQMKKHGESKKERLEYIIGSFIKDKIDLFSTNVTRENFSEEEHYEKSIQKIYIMQNEKISDSYEKENQMLLYNEIMKLHELVSRIEFVAK